jgi:hypothetical protein
MPAKESLAFLIEHLKNSRQDGPSPQKPAFWLGAGCSVHDGVPLTADLLRQILPADPNAWGSPQFRFDQFCQSLGTGPARAGYLAPYIQRDIQDDSPYHGLRDLVMAGYADVIFTFNIDSLLEQAFEAGGLRAHRDYLVVNVPELRPEAVRIQIDPQSGPRVRIVKLHGGYEWGINRMTSAEITRYEEPILEAVRSWSGHPAVVCGYSFFHLNVLEAFSRTGGPLFYANLSFPDAPMVLSLMAARNQLPLFIDGELGTFSTLIDSLRGGLPE